MTLTVETGAVVSGADSLISLAYWKTYAAAQGWSYTDGTDDVAIEQAIRRASRYVSDEFSFKGSTVNADQVFSWPRFGVFDEDGWSVDSDDIPARVERAVAEAAWREFAIADSLRPDVTLSDRVKSERVGPLSTTYADLPTSPSASRPDVKVVRDMLKGLLAAGGGVELVRS